MKNYSLISLDLITNANKTCEIVLPGDIDGQFSEFKATTNGNRRKRNLIHLDLTTVKLNTKNYNRTCPR